jgi:hypothetical protein
MNGKVHYNVPGKSLSGAKFGIGNADSAQLDYTSSEDIVIRCSFVRHELKLSMKEKTLNLDTTRSLEVLQRNFL